MPVRLPPAFMPRTLLSTLLCLVMAVLMSCAQPVAAQPASTPIDQAQRAVASAVLPAVTELREAVQHIVPPQSQAAPFGGAVSPAAVALIIRWEVSSPAVYERRYRAPVWPGGASGVTWGIGYDGGHQTRLDIGRDWEAHDHVGALQSTAGITGTASRVLAAELRHADTPFAYARQVFALSTLPAYAARTDRAFGPGVHALPPDARGALVSIVYNRGASMRGDRNREKRHIRDVCVPAADLGCIAAQIRGMKRLWPQVRGLRDRRDSEAQLAERAS